MAEWDKLVRGEEEMEWNAERQAVRQTREEVREGEREREKEGGSGEACMWNKQVGEDGPMSTKGQKGAPRARRAAPDVEEGWTHQREGRCPNSLKH